ncbi:hypothetical protein [Actinocatenispora comari]|jgi:hypothetical protein|nr:hypothetical protein [Actinocatenispora comari]
MAVALVCAVITRRCRTTGAEVLALVLIDVAGAERRVQRRTCG